MLSKNVPNLKRFPFDWKNPTGYLAAIFIEFCLTIYPLQYVGVFMLFAFGLFMFIVAIVDIMKNELRSINKMASRKKFRKEMNEKLSEFIWTHANLKQLSGQRIHE